VQSREQDRHDVTLGAAGNDSAHGPVVFRKGTRYMERRSRKDADPDVVSGTLLAHSFG
jgi:hypothetical protein